MKIRTELQLCEIIDADLIWRKKELTDLKFLLETAAARRERKPALLRGAVTLLYAHWEGFIKAVALSYLEYVATLGLRFEELSSNFLALAARRLLNGGTGAKRVQVHLEITKFFRSGLSQKSNLPYKDGIRTQGNLSSDVLKEIIDSLGLDFSPFEAKSNLIDDILLRSRNTIAHGEYLQMTEERYEELSRDVLEMMENFRTQVQNAAVLHAFQANAHQFEQILRCPQASMSVLETLVVQEKARNSQQTRE
jgi:hypothetical protein